MNPLYAKVRHGARVKFRDARGEVRTGTVNGLLIFPTHCVLNMGGRYGTPCVVYPEQNYCHLGEVCMTLARSLKVTLGGRL